MIKKFFVVLELGKLEYHLHSTRVYQARVPFSKKKNYTVLEFGKLEYCVNFFVKFFFFFSFLFGDNQKINIKVNSSTV